MTKLTTTFSDCAERTTATKASLLTASLKLIGADTRRGFDAVTKAAFGVVQAHSEGAPQRAGYLERYASAAGSSAAAPRATAFKM